MEAARNYWNNTPSFEKELSDILGQIKVAAESGLTRIAINTDEISFFQLKKKLRELGYSVFFSEYSGEEGKPYVITWKTVWE